MSVSACVTLVEVWKERHFILKTDLAQQAYITHALLAGLATMTKQQMEVGRVGHSNQRGKSGWAPQ
jgi:hypothetical protein